MEECKHGRAGLGVIAAVPGGEGAVGSGPFPTSGCKLLKPAQ